jgi:hypothetical protein
VLKAIKLFPRVETHAELPTCQQFEVLNKEGEVGRDMLQRAGVWNVESACMNGL